MKYSGQERISIIVIVYNVENELERCVDSIITQNYDNLEIILVDDGSLDKSGELCDRLAKKDSRIVVIHKENGGLVSARKRGAEAATGAYIAFVDGDDWVDEDMYEKLYLEAKLHNTDIVLSGIVREISTGKKYSYNAIEPGYYDKKRLETELYPKMMFSLESRRGFVDPSLCTKLFCADIIKQALRSVDDKIFYLGEDAATLYPCMLLAKSIYATNVCMYHHNKVIIKEKQYKKEMKYERLFLFYLNLKENFEKTKYRHIMLPQLNGYFLSMLNVRIKEEIDFDIFLFYQVLSFKEKYRYYLPIEKLMEYKNIILYGAGSVGREYYSQLRKNNINVIMWVDKQAEKYRNIGIDVNTIDSIENAFYDVVLLAVKQEELAISITQDLLEKGIPKDKIKWVKPIKDE